MKGQEDKSVDDCEVEEIMRNDLKLTNDFEDKWQFPKPRYYLATILDSGAVRPLSPTLKVHSPKSVFPGIAMLCEGFDDRRERKNTIEFVRSHTRKGNLFKSRHHWDMRTKFLEVRLRCMDKIVEDPFAKRKPPVGVFFIRIPLAVQKAVDDDRRKKSLECENVDRQIDIRKQNSAENELVTSTKRATNVVIKNFAKNKLRDNSTKGSSPKSEKQSCIVEDELVLEDINDKDYVTDGLLPSACRLEPSSWLKDDTSRAAITRPSASGELVKQHRTFSRFQGLRRRIMTVFSCFGNNQVTPVDI